MYPTLAESMAEARLQEGDTYVSRRQNTVAQFIVTRPIMDLCLAAERRPGSRVAKRWREQDIMDLDGTRITDQEAKQTEGEEDMDGTETESD